MATIPTAVALVKGLKGHHFDKSQPIPEFNFFDIFDCDTNAEMLQENGIAVAQRFLTAALDHLAANVLDTKLGNGGHFGIGALLNTQNNLGLIFNRNWAHHLTWVNRVALEYLLPCNEKRFYIIPPDIQGFNQRDFLDPAQALSNLTFVEQQLVNRLFPRVFNTTVFPGFMFQWNTKAQFEGKRWGFSFGTDLWLQGREKLINIDATPRFCNNFNKQCAQLPLALQNKILGSLYYKIERDTRDWTLGLNGDYTLASRGIGKDYTLTFNVEANF